MGEQGALPIEVMVWGWSPPSPGGPTHFMRHEEGRHQVRPGLNRLQNTKVLVPIFNASDLALKLSPLS
jgi:hypothetical protein